MDLIDIGIEVKRARLNLGLSQVNLAKRANVALSRVEAIENGRASEIGFKYLQRLMNEVGLDLRMTTLNANRPTLEDIRAEDDAEVAHAPRLG